MGVSTCPINSRRSLLMSTYSTIVTVRPYYSHSGIASLARIVGAIALLTA